MADRGQLFLAVWPRPVDRYRVEAICDKLVMFAEVRRAFLIAMVDEDERRVPMLVVEFDEPESLSRAFVLQALVVDGLHVCDRPSFVIDGADLDRQQEAVENLGLVLYQRPDTMDPLGRPVLGAQLRRQHRKALNRQYRSQRVAHDWADLRHLNGSRPRPDDVDNTSLINAIQAHEMDGRPESTHRMMSEITRAELYVLGPEVEADADDDGFSACIGRLPSGKTAIFAFTDRGMAEAFSEERRRGIPAPCSNLLEVVRKGKVDGLAINPGTGDSLWIDQLTAMTLEEDHLSRPPKDWGPAADLDIDDICAAFGLTRDSLLRASYRLLVQHHSPPKVLSDLLGVSTAEARQLWKEGRDLLGVFLLLQARIDANPSVRNV